jgi:hypothetical protein
VGTVPVFLGAVFTEERPAGSIEADDEVDVSDESAAVLGRWPLKTFSSATAA